MPPIISARLRVWIYPFSRAQQDDIELWVPAQTGSVIKCLTSDKMNYEFVVHGYWDWRIAAVSSALLSDGDTVIECGANTGTETVFYSDIVGIHGKVYAYEPFQQNFSRLEESANHFQNSNTIVLPFAISNEIKTIGFSPPSEINSGGGHLKNNGALHVVCTTLDEQAYLFDRVKLIHIDIEGAEILALRGAEQLIKRDKPFIIVEAARKNLSRFGFTAKDLFNELESNYSVFQISRFGLSDIQFRDKYPHCNWLCIPKDQASIRARIDKRIKTVGITPCVKPVNPISSWCFSDLFL